MYIHAYIHTYIHTYMHACIHTYIYTYMHAYIHTYIHTYVHTAKCIQYDFLMFPTQSSFVCGCLIVVCGVVSL